MKKSTLAIICATVVIGIVGTLGMVHASRKPARPVADTADEFMNALKREDYPGAFAYLTPTLQRELHGPGALYAEIPARPVEWNLVPYNVAGSSGHYRGSVRYADGREGSADLLLVKSSSESWRVEWMNVE